MIQRSQLILVVLVSFLVIYQITWLSTFPFSAIYKKKGDNLEFKMITEPVQKEDHLEIEDENSEKEVKLFSNPEGKYAGIKITKLMILAGLSILDVLTDFLFGFNLIFDFDNKWNSEIKLEAVKYGYIVLFSCWIPGLVAVIHMTASQRMKYANRKREFALTLVLLFIFYPLAPFLSLFISLWHFNDPKDRKISEVEKIINLAIQIEGNVEAPVQMIITVFLIMKGILNVPWASSEEDSVIDLGFDNEISFHGILPFTTLAASSASILKASVTMNVFNVMIIRMSEGYLPFFCHAIFFRVLAFAFILIYINQLTFFVFLLILVGNIYIGYRITSKVKINKKLKKYLHDKPENLSPPIWLNSLTGVLVPSCHLEVLDLKAVRESNDEEIVELSNQFHKTFKQKIIKWQMILSTAIILITVIVISILVNFTNFKYHPNIYTNLEFNVLCVVLGILGILGLLFLKNIDLYDIFGIRMSEEMQSQYEENIPGGKWAWISVRTIIILLSVSVLLCPAIGGYIICHYQSPTTSFMMVNNIDFDSKSIEMMAIQVRSVYLPADAQTNNNWSNAINCDNTNYQQILDAEGRAIIFGNISIIIDLNNFGKICYERLLQSVVKQSQSNIQHIQNVIILEEERY